MTDLKPQTVSTDSHISQLSDTASSRESSIDVPAGLKVKYDYIEKIGKGSQGQVWLAIRKTDGEKVAIKHLNIHSVTTWKQYELFRREAKILASIDCKGVVPFYEYIEDLDSKPPHVCIVQKYIEGQTLAEMLKIKHRFDTETIYDIIAQVLKILQNLHTHTPPVIHRDIKPSNLILTPADIGHYQVTLIDFGAVANPQVQTGGSTVAGTFGYMPPEQLMGQVVPGSDIYALGALAVQMLSGVSPADIEISGFKLMIEPYLEHVPNHIVQALTQMLEPVLKNRLCDYNALIALFKAQSQNQTPSFIKSLYKFGTTDFKDITYLCQDGSYEVWQNLDIYNLPESIKFWNGKTDIEQISDIIGIPKDIIEIPHENMQYTLTHNRNRGSGRNRDLSPEEIVVFILSIGIILGVKLIDSFFHFNIKARHIPVLTIVTIIVVNLITYIIWNIWKSKKDANNKTTSSPNLSSPFKRIKNAKPTPQIHKTLEYRQTLKQGVKAVGRIIDIYYQAAREDDIEIIDNHAEVQDITRDTNLGYAKFFVHHPPRFLISYQFQINGKSLLGQLVTSTPPEDHYKLGDFITLVVNMDIGKPGKFLAVPYPYPLDNITCPDDIIYEGDINTLNEDIVYL